MRYERPNAPGSKVTVKERYENFIGGGWVPPSDERYFTDTSPVDGGTIAELPCSGAADVAGLQDTRTR